MFGKARSLALVRFLSSTSEEARHWNVHILSKGDAALSVLPEIRKICHLDKAYFWRRCKMKVLTVPALLCKKYSILTNVVVPQTSEFPVILWICHTLLSYHHLPAAQFDEADSALQRIPPLNMSTCSTLLQLTNPCCLWSRNQPLINSTECGMSSVLISHEILTSISGDS